VDFFNKLGKKASKTYKITAEKTGKLAKEAKLRLKINENKSDIMNEMIYRNADKWYNRIQEMEMEERNCN